MGIILTKSRAFVACFIIAFAIFPAHAAPEGRQQPALVSLRVFPGSTTLSGARASQQFIVVGEYTDGLERDLTSEARFSLSDSNKGEINRSGRFVVRSSGELILTAAVGDRNARATIRVEEAEKPRPVTFAREIE